MDELTDNSARIPPREFLARIEIFKLNSADTAARREIRGHLSQTNEERPSMETQRVFNISEVCTVARASRTVIYEAIKKGELVARKRGRRTVILSDDPSARLNNLSPIKHAQ